jgi:Fe-S-cluster-containing dehydrogenase component
MIRSPENILELEGVRSSERHHLFHDSERCIGCYSCELHCKMKNNLPIGPRLCRIIEIGPRIRNNTLRMDFHFLPCFHCELPFCANR